MQTFLAIDIGASGGRHIVGWVEGDVIQTKEVYRFENGASMRGAHLCWDADGLEKHVLAGLKAAKDAGYTPSMIGIDTWAVDYAFLDKDGNRLGELVAYRDSRTDGMDTELEKSLSFGELYRITGIAKQPFNTVYQMMAVLKEHPEYREQADDFLLVPEYLSYRLTGCRAHEWTNVSTTALASASSHSWSEKVLAKAGLPESWFKTPIVEPGTVLGAFTPEVAAQVGYSAEVVLVATHDTGSAYMAVPAKNDQAAFLSSGTWSLLGTELATPCTTSLAERSGFTNEGGYAHTTRFLKNIMGMWMLQCLRHEDSDRLSYAQMAELAARSTYPAWVDAADNRFLAPASMTEEVRQALKDQGAPEPESFGDICRAVTVGLAVCYRDAIGEMATVTGKTFSAVNIVGGGSNNVTLNRLTAELTGLPVYAGPTEGTALGNLAAQMIAAGVFADLAAFRAALPASFEIREF